MNQNDFDKCLQSLSKRRESTLKLFLQGKNDSEIAAILVIEEVTVRTHFSDIYTKFRLSKDTEDKRRDKLIKLFCKFKRELVAHSLRDEFDCLRVDDYLIIENLRSDDSNFRLIEGTEYLYQKDYQSAIRIFKQEIIHDRTNPIVRIFLNNTKAYQQPYKPFRIAVVVSYSPQNNSHVDSTDNVLRGIADAQSQFNENGGRDGRWLEIIIADDQNQQEVSRKLAESLSDVENILAVIGHHSSEGTEAALTIYKERSIAVVSPTSTSSRLQAENFFRTIGSTKAVAKIYVQYITDLGLDKIAIFYHQDNEYSQILKDDLEEAFLDSKARIIEQVNIKNSLLNITNELKNITKQGCRAALVISSIETNKIALDIISANSKPESEKLKLMFSTSFPEGLILKRILKCVEGVTFVRPDLTQESGYMTQATKNWHQDVIDWRVGTSYAAMQALIEAIRASEKTTREEILKQLKNIACSSDASRFGLNWSSPNNLSSSEREYYIAGIHNGIFQYIPQTLSEPD
jgi:ABC-type branched-subunit amino acid transport system substrate-binding protein